jgi:hypothetical protein
VRSQLGLYNLTDLIRTPRTILYPELKDHEVVRRFPLVQGVDRNVFFFSHNNAENAESDSVSKYNMFEVRHTLTLRLDYGSINQLTSQVEMIRDLVLYFLKQGLYDGAGDIAVLCAYLGQLQKVRAALRDLKVAVSVDERDEEQLERTGLAGNDEMGFTQVQVVRHVSSLLKCRGSTILILCSQSDSYRHSGHLPGPRSKDRHYFLGQKFWLIRRRS